MRRTYRRIRDALFDIDANIRWRMHVSTWCHHKVPVIGRRLARFVDRTLLWAYGLDVYSYTVNVASLSMSHPVGILLGGNGVVSPGRVVIMSGVKFVGRRPDDAEYLARHREQRVFQLGDNVVIGVNSVVVGPIDICDNVVIGAMSLVNRSITEPGVYAGVPVKKVSAEVDEVWVAHMAPPAALPGA